MAVDQKRAGRAKGRAGTTRIAKQAVLVPCFLAAFCLPHLLVCKIFFKLRWRIRFLKDWMWMVADKDPWVEKFEMRSSNRLEREVCLRWTGMNYVKPACCSCVQRPPCSRCSLALRICPFERNATCALSKVFNAEMMRQRVFGKFRWSEAFKRLPFKRSIKALATYFAPGVLLESSNNTQLTSTHNSRHWCTPWLSNISLDMSLQVLRPIEGS